MTAAKGLVLTPHHSYESVPPLDVLVYPGGRGTRPHLRDEEQLAWVREQRDEVELLTSVCTGSLVYAAAGFLARPAGDDPSREHRRTACARPVHRAAHDRPVRRRRRHHHGAGVSAGIDMALHLVVRLAGADRARQVRSGIQYDPEPPV